MLRCENCTHRRLLGEFCGIGVPTPRGKDTPPPTPKPNGNRAVRAARLYLRVICSPSSGTKLPPASNYQRAVRRAMTRIGHPGAGLPSTRKVRAVKTAPEGA